MNNKLINLVGILRILFGWIFIWAFFDKVYGLGFATKASNSVINGGSATSGFLENATSGPLSGFYQSMSQSGFVEWLYLIGLLLLGIAFIFGIGMRLATWGATIFMVLLWSSVLPPVNNPVIDDHIIYALSILILGQLNAGDYIGLGKWWQSTRIVKTLPWLT